VPWRGIPSIDDSSARISKFDNDRKDADSGPGRVIPKPQDIALGETKRFDLAILHVDIDNYSVLAGQMKFRGAARFLSVYLTEMTYQIKDFGGDLEGYGGDRVTALFGAGQEKAAAVKSCMDCALTMKAVVRYALSPYLNKNGLPAFKVGIGVDYGPTWIERVGVRNDSRLTLIGPTVSIASKLQDLAGPDQILIGHDVYSAMSKNYQDLCKVRVATKPSDWPFTQGDPPKPYPFYNFDAEWTDVPKVG
jgi:adenylate cyclase